MSDFFATPWSVTSQAPLPMGFPRQEYWVGCQFFFLFVCLFCFFCRESSWLREWTHVSCTVDELFTTEPPGKLRIKIIPYKLWNGLSRLSMDLGYYLNIVEYMYIWCFPHSSVSKESACDAGDLDSIPGSGRSPGERNPLQYSCLWNPMERGAW